MRPPGPGSPRSRSASTCADRLPPASRPCSSSPSRLGTAYAGLGDLAGLTGGAVFETRLRAAAFLQARRRARVHVREGATVKAGDVIITLDTSEVDRQIVMLKALSEAASAQLALIGREASGVMALRRQAHGRFPRAARRRAREGDAGAYGAHRPGRAGACQEPDPRTRIGRVVALSTRPAESPEVGGAVDIQIATADRSLLGACSIRCGAACPQPSPRNSRPTRGARHEDTGRQGHRVQRGRGSDHGRRRRGPAAVCVIKPTSVPCSERYHHSTAFALERGGVLLTAADLQSRLAGKDVGVIDNVSIARSRTARPRRHHRAHAQGLDVAARLAQRRHQLPMGPAVGAGQDAACLSYSVLLPADFAFNRGGALPGISGVEPDMPAAELRSPRVWPGARKAMAERRCA